MHNQTYDAGICVMTKIVQLISGKWKPIILYLIQHDINRFGVLKKCMPKISKKVLTNQLRELEKDELIVRHVHEVLAPQVVTYTLTAKGISTRKLIDEMIQWGMVYFKEDYRREAIEEFVTP
jgi:DNA-binding HxlR family transcriptional regulator